MLTNQQARSVPLTIDSMIDGASIILRRMLSDAKKAKHQKFSAGVLMAFQNSILNNVTELYKSDDPIDDKAPFVEGHYFTAIKEFQSILDIKLRSCIAGGRRYFGSICVSVVCDDGSFTVTCESREGLTATEFARKTA